MIDPGAVELATLHAREWHDLLREHRRRPEDDHTRALVRAAERAKKRALGVVWRALVEWCEEEAI